MAPRPNVRTAHEYSNATGCERLRPTATDPLTCPATASDLVAESSHRGAQPPSGERGPGEDILAISILELTDIVDSGVSEQQETLRPVLNQLVWLVANR